MSHRFLQINAFTAQPFAGNPAAVVLLESPMSQSWMQLVARDFNLSETAFLSPLDSSSTCDWNLRWFTPRVEVDLCGHATLASTHALREWNLMPENVRFHTRSGILQARSIEDEIALDFPATPPTQSEMLHGLPQVLGVTAEEILWCGRSQFDIVLQLNSPQSVARIEPNFAVLKEFEARGVIVTAEADEGNWDFVSRFFGPRVGVDEDPVTGSAHCALAPFWAQRLGKTTMQARQISERGGEMTVQVLADRVELRGQCVTILRGEVLR
jgi:PhzF family phenazine biosynthesis protein